MLVNLAVEVDNFDASDCSDAIRLFGQWVEDGGQMAPGAGGTTQDAWRRDITDSNAIKDAYRPGVPSAASRSAPIRDPGHLVLASTDGWRGEVEAVWSDGTGRFQGTQPRRLRGQGVPIEQHIIPLMRAPKEFSGMAAKRATGLSNVLKLDRLFGLLVGADISGTTTDTVAALEAMANVHPNAQFLTAGYYLLPLATIVYNCHHTLLEVALALSLNKCIDYRIGFYETLLPSGNLGAEFSPLRRIVLHYSLHYRNRHFLVWYQDCRVAGAIWFDDAAEVAVLKTQGLSRATEMLRGAPTLLPYPDKRQVVELIQRWAPALQPRSPSPLSPRLAPPPARPGPSSSARPPSPKRPGSH